MCNHAVANFLMREYDVNCSINRHNGRDTLHINGKPFPTHEIIRQLGRGANGIVYLSRNIVLDRLEALKVWRTMRTSDHRDKAKQGIAEAQKLAAANREHSVEIFTAQLFEGVPVASMEYVDGQTLREWKQKDPRSRTLLQLAHLYLEAIEGTTTKTSMHGDPHLSNVLVYRYSPDIFTDELRVKLCDYGTSLFSGRESSSARHWRIVEESVLELTSGLDGSDWALSCLCDFKGNLATIDLAKAAGTLPDRQLAQIINSPLRDYLRCFNTR